MPGRRARGRFATGAGSPHIERLWFPGLNMNDRDGDSPPRARGLAAAKVNARRVHGIYYELKMLVSNYYLLLFQRRRCAQRQAHGVSA